MLDAIKLSASVCAAPAPKSALPFSPLSFHLIRASGKKNASAKPDNFLPLLLDQELQILVKNYRS